jgi:hypothetical protein
MSVFHRRLDRPIPHAARAEGCWIVGTDGRRFLDASGGAMVANLGHGAALDEVAEAVAAEIRGLGYLNGTQFTSAATERLATALAPHLPGDLRFSYFLASGSEAIEAAVKLARQFWVEEGRASKWRVISRLPSYHGNTLTALSLSGRERYRRDYGPLLTDFPRIPCPDPYRRPDDRPEAEALEAAIQRHGADSVAAFLVEPIGGSSSGAVAPSAEYFQAIARTCARHDVLLIADEIVTGMGRTGRWFASHHWNLRPDVLVLGKGLSAGAVPLSALAASPRIVERLRVSSGSFHHAQTYSHQPSLCAAGLAVVRILEREGLVERVAAREPELQAALAALGDLAVVGDVRGRGFLWAVELVADRDSKEPFPRARRFAESVADAAFAEGLVVWPNSGCVDGERGDLVMVAPPFTITAEEIEEIGRRLRRAVESATRETTR